MEIEEQKVVNRRHIFPGRKKGERLRPVFDKLVDANMSISELGRLCGIPKQTLSSRFIADDCRLSELEKMAAALGYDVRLTFFKRQGDV